MWKVNYIDSIKKYADISAPIFKLLASVQMYYL